MTGLLSIVKVAHIGLDSSHSQQGLCKGLVVNFSSETNVRAAGNAFHLLLKNAVCHFEHDPVPHTETPTLIQRVVDENTPSIKSIRATPFNDLCFHLCGLGRERKTNSRRDLRAAASKVS